jgi:hypothetical protein
LPKELKFTYRFKLDKIEQIHKGYDHPLLAIKCATTLNQIEKSLKIEEETRKKGIIRWKNMVAEIVSEYDNLNMRN